MRTAAAWSFPCGGCFLWTGGGPYELRLPIFLRPLGGALKNRSAAPASPPCFRRRRRSAPLLFESTLESETSVFYKTKSPAYFCTLSIFGGRGWITQAAHLKRPRRGLFAAGTYSGGRCCSNPPLRRFTNFQIKQKLQRHNNAGVLGGRGWIARAAHLKKPRRGFFALRTIRRADAVRIHPPDEFSFVAKQKPQRTFIR